MKIAFTGTSGSGKTTLAKYTAERFDHKFISGSSGSLKTEEDIKFLNDIWDIQRNGHADVVRDSALHPIWGWNNQTVILKRRIELIQDNYDFVTDRSTLDNLVYCINQCGYHRECTDVLVKGFSEYCLRAMSKLTHLVYIKAVQPKYVEDNGSRIPNWWYQKSIDAQFNYWLMNFFIPQLEKMQKELKILVIDFWDWEQRKAAMNRFLSNIIQ